MPLPLSRRDGDPRSNDDPRPLWASGTPPPAAPSGLEPPRAGPSALGETSNMDEGGTQDDQSTGAWRQAAADLGLDVVAPFSVSVEDHELSCIALVRGFGHRSGMLVLPLGAHVVFDKAVRARLVDEGYSYSFVGASYQVYDRALFVETLNDWGWQGDRQAAPALHGRALDVGDAKRRPLALRCRGRRRWTTGCRGRPLGGHPASWHRPAAGIGRSKFALRVRRNVDRRPVHAPCRTPRPIRASPEKLTGDLTKLSPPAGDLLADRYRDSPTVDA